MLRSVAIVTVALVAVSSAAAARPAHRDPSAMTALVAEWSVVPSEGILAAGTVRIRLRNVGVEAHELVLTRTSEFSEKLPLDDDQAVASPVGEPVLLAPGQSRTVTVHVARGSYVLLDNLPWHYWQGAWAAFSVR
jgi:uncharacterized cupredoxin-like copper-binding protein